MGYILTKHLLSWPVNTEDSSQNYVEYKNSPLSTVNRVDAIQAESDDTYTVSEEEISRLTSFLNCNDMQGEQW